MMMIRTTVPSPMYMGCSSVGDEELIPEWLHIET